MTAILVPKWLWRLTPKRWRVSTVGTFDYPMTQNGAYDSRHNLNVLYFVHHNNVGNNHVTLFCKFSK